MRFWKVEFLGGGLSELLEALSNSPISDLALDWVTGLKEFFAATPIDTLVKWFSRIENLSLRGNYLDDNFSELFAEILLRNQSLLSISLWDNQIADHGAIVIGNALRSNKTLLSLSLSKNMIGDMGADHLFLSITKFKLSASQLFDRKKTIRDLEKRKKESINRRRRVTKGI